MFCINCGSKQSEGVKFCQNCGTELVSTDKIDFGNLNATDEKKINKIVAHLEFLGYSVEKISEEKDGERLIYGASHPRHYKLAVFEISSDLVLLKCNLQCKKLITSDIPEPTYRAINLLNERMSILKVYANKEDVSLVLRFEVVYGGRYEKDLFGAFMDTIYGDFRIFSSVEDYDKLFLEPN